MVGFVYPGDGDRMPITRAEYLALALATAPGSIWGHRRGRLALHTYI